MWPLQGRPPAHNGTLRRQRVKRASVSLTWKKNSQHITGGDCSLWLRTRSSAIVWPKRLNWKKMEFDFWDELSHHRGLIEKKCRGCSAVSFAQGQNENRKRGSSRHTWSVGGSRECCWTRWTRSTNWLYVWKRKAIDEITKLTLSMVHVGWPSHLANKMDGRKRSTGHALQHSRTRLYRSRLTWRISNSLSLFSLYHDVVVTKRTTNSSESLGSNVWCM